MHRRLWRTLTSALCLLAVGVTVPLAHAGPKDADALKLDKQAMDDDYLNVKFDEAEKKLRQALNTCGASGCDPKLKAKIYMHLGIILVNAKKMADGTAAFSEGLKIDSTAAPEADFASDEVKKAYESAKSSTPLGPPPSDTGTGTGTPPGPKPGGEPSNDLKHEPIVEAQVGYAVPVYLGPQEGATRYLLFYKAPGADWAKVEMKKMGKYYGESIPCKDVKIAGKIKYYIQALDAQGDALGSAGSKKQPIEFDLKQKIAGDLPAFPGKDAPEKCAGVGDCPPGMNEKGCSGGKGYGEKCTGPGQCNRADKLACIEGTCQQGEEGDGGEGGEGGEGGDDEKPSLNLLTFAFSIDDAIVSGKDLCSTENSIDGTYVCFRQDRDQRLYTAGDPRDPQYATREKGSISGPPFAIGTMRALLGYDRAIPLKGAPLIPAVGVRLGYAFNGGPTVPNPKDGDKKFMPFHAELRVTGYIGKNSLSRTGIRPYIFASGGIAQVDAKIPNVPVSDDCDLKEGIQTCPNPRRKIQVDAYRKMGTGFAALGGGVLYAVKKNSSLLIELKGAAFFGSPGFAISPSIGFVQQL